MSFLYLKLSIVLTLLSGAIMACGCVDEEIRVTPSEQKYFHVEQEVVDDGKTIEKTMIVGPPSPPVGYERRPVEPKPDQERLDAGPSSHSLSKEME